MSSKKVEQYTRELLEKKILKLPKQIGLELNQHIKGKVDFNYLFFTNKGYIVFRIE